MGFSSNVPLARPGDLVTAAKFNQPISGLSNDVDYLWSLLQLATAGSALYAWGTTVEAEAAVGMPVYFNAANQRFERGLAQAAVDDSGVMTVTESSRVWGVVYAKSSATVADVLVYGVAQLDITAALDAGVELTAGTYYLSRSTPGKLITTRTPVAVMVLKADGAGTVFVSPQWNDLLTDHTHLHFKLKPWPAGTHTPPAGHGRHTITAPDTDVEGWLPASSFSDAPVGAVFGYNINANPQLKSAWPPLPPAQASLVKDGLLVASGTNGLVLFDTAGIWWMSNCYDDSPFPPGLTTNPGDVSDYSETSAVSEGEDVCPHPYNMELDLYFTLPAYMDAASVVSSLISTDPRIRVRCAADGTRNGNVGALALALDLTFMTADNAADGSLAFKTLDPVTQTLRRGRVAAGVYSLSNDLQLSGTASVVKTIGGQPRTVYYGDVGVDTVTALNRELFVELIRLDGVEERYENDVMFLSFPAGEETLIRGRIHIPENLDITAPQMQLKFRLLGTTAGALPALTVTYRRILQAGTTPTALPLTDTALTVDTTATLGAVNEYVDTTSVPFTIAAGDDVLFTVERSAGDAYPGEVGVMRQVGLITSA